MCLLEVDIYSNTLSYATPTYAYPDIRGFQISPIRLLFMKKMELTIDELIEMHEQEQDIEELESLDPDQSEDRMTVGNLTESVSLIAK
ncbi:hypothetical protein TNCV_4018121 [Trichonephila clavipes]|nr:hypothetical protein TNCV_4018121 [Trichonephila clavipes]